MFDSARMHTFLVVFFFVGVRGSRGSQVCVGVCYIAITCNVLCRSEKSFPCPGPSEKFYPQCNIRVGLFVSRTMEKGFYTKTRLIRRFELTFLNITNDLFVVIHIAFFFNIIRNIRT